VILREPVCAGEPVSPLVEQSLVTKPVNAPRVFGGHLMTMWKKSIAAALALGVVLSAATPAAAASNIFQQGVADDQLVGGTVYY
jgi:hypothetical protein